MSLKLRELIRKVRQCKTAEDERSVINKESAEIRNMGKVNSTLFLGAIRLAEKQELGEMYFHAHARLPD